MIDAQGQIDHLHVFGNDFGPAAEAREKMADVGYVPSHLAVAAVASASYC